MPVGMNKCVFRTERRTFERSIITKWTFSLTREGKIKKGLQGWNYRQGELQERLRGTSARPALKWRARPAWEHRKARSENDDCPARRPKPYPIPVTKAIEDRRHVSCDQAILLLSCEQWFLQDGHSVRPGETTARRVSFFPFVLKKEKKTPDRRLRGTQRTYQKTVSTESHSEQERKSQRKTFLGIHCQDHKSHLWLKLFTNEISRSAVTKHKWLSCCHSYFSQCIYNVSGCCILCFLSQLESLRLFLV